MVSAHWPWKLLSSTTIWPVLRRTRAFGLPALRVVLDLADEAVVLDGDDAAGLVAAVIVLGLADMHAGLAAAAEHVAGDVEPGHVVLGRDGMVEHAVEDVAADVGAAHAEQGHAVVLGVAGVVPGLEIVGSGRAGFQAGLLTMMPYSMPMALMTPVAK